MAFLQNYLLYNRNNECHDNYHIWSALALLSAVVSRKVYLDRGHMIVFPNIYVCLVGDQGSRKSTAKDKVRDLCSENFSKIPIAPSVVSKEKITQFLSTPDSIRTYRNERGILEEYHPYVFFINELKNFLNFNPAGMIDFLTDIYDRRMFDVGTKNQGDDFIPNPYFVILACETPDWIRSRLKMDIISGGFTRRMIFVYELGKKRPIPHPDLAPEEVEARSRVIAHLKRVEPLALRFDWGPGARDFFADWYCKLTPPHDPIMRGFHSSIDTQLIKVTILLAMCEWPVVPLITVAHLEVGLEMFRVIEPNMVRLTQGVGRNELAGPTAKLVEVLEQNGGELPEKKLRGMVFSSMQPHEYEQVIQHLRRIEVLAPAYKRTVGGVEREMVATLAYYELLKAAKERQKNESV